MIITAISQTLPSTFTPFQLLNQAFSQHSSDMMQTAITILAQETAVRGTALWLMSEEQDVLSMEAMFGLSNTLELTAIQELPISLLSTSHSNLSITIHHNQITHFNETAQAITDQQLLFVTEATSIFVLPLAVGDTILGIVTLHNQQSQQEINLDFAQLFVQQLAILVQNKHLHEEIGRLNQTLEQRIAVRTRELAQEKERQETMHQITARLTKTLDLDKLITETLHQLAKNFQVEDGAVLLNDDSFSSHLFFEAMLKDNSPLTLPNGAYDTISHWVMVNRQSVHIHKLQEDGRWATPFTNICSVVAAPLTADRDLHGVIILSSEKSHYFTLSQMRLVESVAVQLAAAINNARLHDYVRSQVIRLGDMLYQQEIEDSQKKAILTSISDGVIASDNQGLILHVNPAAEEMLGLDGTQLVGQPIEKTFESFQPEGQQKILQALMNLQTSGKEHLSPLHMEEVFLQTDQRFISARLTTALTPTLTAIGVVTVLRDITKEVEANRAKIEFISTVSHELRTPMTSIKGYADFLHQEVVGTLTQQQKHFVDVIRRNADRLSLLINDLLDVSRIEAGKVKLNFREVQLKDLATQVIETMLIPAQNKDLYLHLDASSELPTIRADAARITQVLTNLVGNAIAYTQTGGVAVALKRVANAVQVTVQDTGIGISPEALSRIFERFFRAEHEVVHANPGTGLGLAIVKAFVEMHDGRIWIDSELGKGSTFTFILPIGFD